MSQSQKNFVGKTIVLTRTKEGIAASRGAFERLGARVLEIPLIDVDLAQERLENDEVLAEIAGYDWIVFTSANAVNGFFNRFFHTYNDIRFIGPAKFACIGPATVAELAQFHLASDVVPAEAEASALGKAMLDFETLDNLKILVPVGNRNRDTLVCMLEKEGRAIVDTMLVYETKENDISHCADVALFRKEGADAIVFASPSSVESFVAQAKELRLEKDAKKPLACAIGPSTASAMRKAGIPVELEAPEHTMDGVCAALLEKIGV